ncbi:MAG: glycoside hydrolase family 65 protein [Nitrosomonas sp.]|nr:glycoside hydrolase family 65 protein [Nitrosomonas sp.]
MTHWSLIYETFDPKEESLREALCTLGNGCFATRGAAEESQADEIHYPGTYLAGGYNRLDSCIAGRTITNEDLVNFPNWLLLKFRPEDGDWFNLMAVDIITYRQELDLKKGLLKRLVRFRDHNQREFTVESRRFVHMANQNLAAIEYSITAENWSGRIIVRSALDGSVINAGVARYRELNSTHLETLSLCEGSGPDIVCLLTRTNQSHIHFAEAARTRIYKGEQQFEPERKTYKEEAIIGQELSFELEQGKTITVEKIVSIYSSRDRAISEPSLEARYTLQQCERFSDLLVSHESAWKYLWRKSDVVMKPSDSNQMIVRLHIFHLLQSVSPNTVGLDSGVPARGFHGEGYRGHIFWDELFIFPFYTYRLPHITRSLLLYRYRRLNMARHLASAEGYKGAMYPWQSGSNGREETQIVHLNPRSGTWGPDYSRYQRHVNIAIVYNAWQYYMLTGDQEFMALYGAEMILEIARFLANITHYNKTTQRYEIIGVMGPDEYHEKYPDEEAPGLRNNAYTNVMTVWVLERALELLGQLSLENQRELKEKLSLHAEELEHWRNITHKMTVPFHENGIISQFEGYENLQEFDWEYYRGKYGDIKRLDRILKAEGDNCDRYKVSKQADVLMLFYLLPPKELRSIFQQLGYEFDDDMVKRNTDYYLARTSHGSTLSRVVHASVLDRIDRTEAWEMFCAALKNDLLDVQGPTPEGIHLGAMAGTVDIVLRHYGGIDTSEEIIAFHPRLPETLHGLHFRLRFRNYWFELDINKQTFTLIVEADGMDSVVANVNGTLHKLIPGEPHEFPLKA